MKLAGLKTKTETVISPPGNGAEEQAREVSRRPEARRAGMEGVRRSGLRSHVFAARGNPSQIPDQTWFSLIPRFTSICSGPARMQSGTGARARSDRDRRLRSGALRSFARNHPPESQGLPDGVLWISWFMSPMDHRAWRETEELAWRLDRVGKVLPLTDLIIAVCALRTGAEVLTRDHHFEMIPELPLATW